MKKIAKIVQSLVLCGFLCIAAPKKGYCFLQELLPPLPFDITIDFGDDAAKVISYLKAIYRELQTIETAANSLNLTALTGGNLGGLIDGIGKYTKGPKTPTQPKLAASTRLGLKEGDVREGSYVGAFKTLFLTTGGNQEARIQYHKKSVEFKQDMIVHTYVTGRLTEDYLVMVEKTIRRLDRCQQGKEDEGCTFFGLKWTKIESTNEPSNDKENNAGLMGQARNAYIVITVYDRLLRIVEDLAATEAMFQSARNLDLAKPAEAQPTSDASQYINKKFHFTHHQTNETGYASGTVVALDDMNVAKILGQLQIIDEWQQEAMILHNLKVKLPEYKAMYRKYLKAKEVHERALNALKDCDDCAKTFLDTYNNGLTEGWGETSPVNDYANRSGISRELIEDYQKAVQTTIIETSEDLCPGYYTGPCPSGYKTGETCKIVTMKEIHDENDPSKVVRVEEQIEEQPNYHECVMDSAQQDSGKAMDMLDDDNQNSDEVAEQIGGDVEYLEDGASADEVHKDSRIKTERTWRVGEKKLMQLTKSHQLKFLPWNDQKNLQEMYLRQKYNNLKLIALSVDDGVNTFKVAKDYVENPATLSEIKGKLEAKESYKRAKDLIKAATRCKAATTVRDELQDTWCAGTCKCSVTTPGDASGIINGTRYFYQDHPVTDEEGNVVGSEQKCDKKETETWYQYVDVENARCDFTQAPRELEPLASEGCPGNWDLTGEFLVKNYFKAVDLLGNCATTTKDAAENMRTTAKAAKRRVAQDILKSIVDLREEQDRKMREWVKAYEAELSDMLQRMADMKIELGNLNRGIDEKTEEKNAATQERKRSELRVEAISREITELTQQLAVSETQPVIDSRTGRKTRDIKQQCSLEVQIYKLKYEGRMICKDADTGKHKQCQDFASALEAWDENYHGYQVCEEVRKLEKDDLKEGDLPFEEDKKVINSLVEDNFITAFAKDLQTTKHVKLLEADRKIDELDRILADLKAERDTLNQAITALKQQIEEKANRFADEYVQKETQNQQNLDEKNMEFEEFVEREDSKRMLKGTKRVCKRVPPIIGIRTCEDVAAQSFKDDNLESTLKNILYTQDSLAGKDQIIWTGMHKAWQINEIEMVKQAILSLGVHNDFKGVGSMASINTAELLAKEVRDLIVSAATEVLAEYIKEIDEAVKAERKDAKDIILNLKNELVGEDRASETQLNYISEHDNYAKSGPITIMHENLLKELRTPKHLNRYYVTDLSDFFGIPADGIMYTEPECKLCHDEDCTSWEACFRDDKYFVGLPARGNNYIEKSPTDENAGRDFRSPQEPLLNLPPLREVFFFNTMDYEDIPINDGVPAWTIFLNKKYAPRGWGDYPRTVVPDDEAQTWEYMPETWLYLLARPNMRDDGKYRHTFEERSYGDGFIKDLLVKPGQDDDVYNLVIARSGVYPCQLVDKTTGKTMIVDVAMGAATGYIIPLHLDRIEDIAFNRGRSIVEHLPVCKEIAYNTDKTTPCGTYSFNKGKSGLCHLLADHGIKNDDGDKVQDAQTSISGSVSSEAYTKYSELGNLFKFQERHSIWNFLNVNKIVYRPMQKKIHEYLLDEDHTDNDINRQKADRATFTHSIFSTFLDAVNMEHNARKNMENTKQNLVEALESLCQQIHAQGKVVGDYGDEENCDEDCKAKKCAQFIMDNGGLASSANDDTKYGATGEYKHHQDYPSFEGVSCRNGTSGSSFYEELFCLLDQWKEEKIELSRNAEISEEVDTVRPGEKETVWKLGFEKLDLAKTGPNDIVDKDKVKERMQIIYNYDTAFRADDGETVFLSPTIGKLYTVESGLDKNPQKVKEEITTEKSKSQENRTVAREGDEDAIKAMGNQFQVVPYCPLYMNNKQNGL